MNRKANKKDLNEVIQLIKDSFGYAWKKTHRKFDEKYFRKNILNGINNDICTVEIDKGKIIAFAWASKQKDFFGNPCGEIKLIVIDRDYQNQGIGSRLLKHSEEKLGTKDLRLDCLCINPASKLYKRKGYKEFIISFRKYI